MCNFVIESCIGFSFIFVCIFCYMYYFVIIVFIKFCLVELFFVFCNMSLRLWLLKINKIFIFNNRNIKC